MRFKIFLFDRTFLSLIWFDVVGGIIDSAITLLFLMGIWVLSDSSNTFFKVLDSIKGAIIFYSIVSTVVFNTARLLMNFDNIKYYLLFSPIDVGVSLKSTFAEVIRNNKRRIPGVTHVFPLGIFSLIAILFLLAYLSKKELVSALLGILSFTIIFSVAFTTVHLTKIIIEVILLIFRYIIQLRR